MPPWSRLSPPRDGQHRQAMTWPLRITVACVCAAPLPAVEPAVGDLRLIAEARPVAYRFTWESPRGSRGGDDRLDQAWSAGAGWRWARTAPGRPLGLLLGGELLGQYDALAGARRLGAAARLEAGLVAGLHNRLVLTLAPLAGAGFGRWTLEGGSYPATSLRGPQLEAGVRLGLRWSLDPAWGVSLDGGWLWARERCAGGGTRLELVRSGATAALALAWTLDPVTRRLE
jgi:hypothetical protein